MKGLAGSGPWRLRENDDRDEKLRRAARAALTIVTCSCILTWIQLLTIHHQKSIKSRRVTTYLIHETFAPSTARPQPPGVHTSRTSLHERRRGSAQDGESRGPAVELQGWPPSGGKIGGRRYIVSKLDRVLLRRDRDRDERGQTRASCTATRPRSRDVNTS